MLLEINDSPFLGVRFPRRRRNQARNCSGIKAGRCQCKTRVVQVFVYFLTCAIVANTVALA
jgi:hypothetical protein